MIDKDLENLLISYKTPDKAFELLKKAKIVFVVGVSGAGKNTIIKDLLKTGKYKLIVSHTTRSPRENHGTLEQDGQDYHFIDQQKAKNMLENGKFVEAKVYSENVYGTSIREVEKAYNEGKVAISDIEVQGVSEYKAIAPNVTAVFILPPDFDTWQTRLRLRYGGKEPTKADLGKRMETAKNELQEALSKDYFEFVINDDLNRAVEAVDEIAAGNLSVLKNQEAKKLAQKLLQKLV